MILHSVCNWGSSSVQVVPHSLWLPSLLSTWLLSVTVAAPPVASVSATLSTHRMLCVAPPQQIAFQLGTFLFLNFNLLFDLEKPTFSFERDPLAGQQHSSRRFYSTKPKFSGRVDRTLCKA